MWVYIHVACPKKYVVTHALVELDLPKLSSHKALLVLLLLVSKVFRVKSGGPGRCQFVPVSAQSECSF